MTEEEIQAAVAEATSGGVCKATNNAPRVATGCATVGEIWIHGATIAESSDAIEYATRSATYSATNAATLTAMSALLRGTP